MHEPVSVLKGPLFSRSQLMSKISEVLQLCSQNDKTKHTFNKTVPFWHRLNIGRLCAFNRHYEKLRCHNLVQWLDVTQSQTWQRQQLPYHNVMSLLLTVARRNQCRSTGTDGSARLLLPQQKQMPYRCIGTCNMKHCMCTVTITINDITQNTNNHNIYECVCWFWMLWLKSEYFNCSSD